MEKAGERREKRGESPFFLLPFLKHTLCQGSSIHHGYWAFFSGSFLQFLRASSTSNPQAFFLASFLICLVRYIKIIKQPQMFEYLFLSCWGQKTFQALKRSGTLPLRMKYTPKYRNNKSPCNGSTHVKTFLPRNLLPWSTTKLWGLDAQHTTPPTYNQLIIIYVAVCYPPHKCTLKLY